MNELSIFNVASSDNMAPYSTVSPTTAEGAAMLFKAMNQADHSVKEFINKNIVVKDVIAQFAQQTDEKTGEVKDTAKIVIFDPDGKSYGTISQGFYKAFCNLCAICGEPTTWKSPITISIHEVPVPKGSMLSFDIVDFGDNLPSPTI